MLVADELAHVHSGLPVGFQERHLVGLADQVDRVVLVHADQLGVEPPPGRPGQQFPQLPQPHVIARALRQDRVRRLDCGADLLRAGVRGNGDFRAASGGLPGDGPVQGYPYGHVVVRPVT